MKVPECSATVGDLGFNYYLRHLGGSPGHSDKLSTYTSDVSLSPKEQVTYRIAGTFEGENFHDFHSLPVKVYFGHTTPIYIMVQHSTESISVKARFPPICETFSLYILWYPLNSSKCHIDIHWSITLTTWNFVVTAPKWNPCLWLEYEKKTLLLWLTL